MLFRSEKSNVDFNLNSDDKKFIHLIAELTLVPIWLNSQQNICICKKYNIDVLITELNSAEKCKEFVYSLIDCYICARELSKREIPNELKFECLLLFSDYLIQDVDD